MSGLLLSLTSRGRPNAVRVLLVAPPWVPVPPPSYGGTELVINNLAEALARQGHEVAIFTTRDSATTLERGWLYEHAKGFGRFGAVEELAHVMASRDFAESWDADIVHDHTMVGAALPAVAPLVLTNHWLFDENTNLIFRDRGTGFSLVAISHAQARAANNGVKVSAVVHHGINIDNFEIGNGKGDYLVFLGRMTPEKGVESAIQVARASGSRLLIAAKMQEEGEVSYFEETIKRQLNEDIEYLGEVTSEEKVALLGNATALLNPINWEEPFGMVMIEAMACGTPVISTPRGSAPEIISPGVNGLMASSLEGLVSAVNQVKSIDRPGCRRDVEDRFSADRMAAEYEVLYASLVV